MKRHPDDFWRNQAHREPSPWLVALKGVVLVALAVAVVIAMSVRG